MFQSHIRGDFFFFERMPSLVYWLYILALLSNSKKERSLIFT